VYFARRGKTKAADYAGFLRRHSTSNEIDAETLARLRLAQPRGQCARRAGSRVPPGLFLCAAT
jgi:hypothetical protein